MPATKTATAGIGGLDYSGLNQNLFDDSAFLDVHVGKGRVNTGTYALALAVGVR
jgi:hypothetical protein